MSQAVESYGWYEGGFFGEGTKAVGFFQAKRKKLDNEKTKSKTTPKVLKKGTVESIMAEMGGPRVRSLRVAGSSKGSVKKGTHALRWPARRRCWKTGDREDDYFSNPLLLFLNNRTKRARDFADTPRGSRQGAPKGDWYTKLFGLTG